MLLFSTVARVITLPRCKDDANRWGMEVVSYHDEARLLGNGDHKVQAHKYSQIMYLVKVFATKCRKALESMESDCSENPSVLENRGFPVKRTKKGQICGMP